MGREGVANCSFTRRQSGFLPMGSLSCSTCEGRGLLVVASPLAPAPSSLQDLGLGGLGLAGCSCSLLFLGRLHGPPRATCPAPRQSKPPASPQGTGQEIGPLRHNPGGQGWHGTGACSRAWRSEQVRASALALTPDVALALTPTPT